MIKAAIPHDDDQRVEALRTLKLLDTPAEERYDRITRQLAEAINVPIAYVALVDQKRQWLKSSIGDLECQIDRDLSFCTHTILQNKPLIVPDTLKDPRFVHNPMVTGPPHLRFYVGVPLQSRGHNIGTLCVADHEPRDIDPSHMLILRAFAARIEQVMNQAPSVFISYSHEDEVWKDRLVRHLAVFKNQDLLDFWVDRNMAAGVAWREEISDAMEASNVAILLVSTNFLTSKFILDEEVPRLIERREKEGLRIVPLLIQPCGWQGVPWLRQLNVFPKDGQPLSAGSDHQIDVELADLASTVCAEQPERPVATGAPLEVVAPVRKPEVAVPQDLPPASEPLSPSSTGEVEEDPPIRLHVRRQGAESSETETHTFNRKQITIGRATSNDLAFDDPVVSHQHAELLVDGTSVLVVDLGSRNFTYLDGEALDPRDPRPVGPDSIIRIGDQEITCQRLLKASAIPSEDEDTHMPTEFTRTFVNPYLEDVGELSDVLESISLHYDDEAPVRREVALEEALDVAVRDSRAAHRVVARWLLTKATRSGRSS